MSTSTVPLNGSWFFVRATFICPSETVKAPSPSASIPLAGKRGVTHVSSPQCCVSQGRWKKSSTELLFFVFFSSAPQIHMGLEGKLRIAVVVNWQGPGSAAGKLALLNELVVMPSQLTFGVDKNNSTLNVV